MFTVKLFGSPEIQKDGQPVRLVRRKSRAVLYYVAANARPVNRETLLSVFWPDTPRPAAQQTLRTTLHGLRKTLGPALAADSESAGLADGVQVDALDFERALASPALDIPGLKAALGLYRGDFLAGFSLPGVQAFEDWAAVEREHYRRLAIQGLTRLSAAYEAEGDYPSALNSLDRAMAFNPLQEDLQRESIRLAYLAGDRPEAIRRYDRLRRLLDEEMGVPPMAETRALYDAIISDRLASAGPLPGAPSAAPAGPALPAQAVPAAPRRPAGSLPFSGREAELRTLGELSASRKLVLIEGEPGIGKTRLAEEFLLTRPGISLVGRARELEQNLPYQPIIEALRSLTLRLEWPSLIGGLRASLPAIWFTETSRLLPELAGAIAGGQTPAASADEPRLWEGVSQFLEALALQQPVFLFLDDLHWADASTLGLLGYLVRQARGPAVFFLATAQPARPRSPFSSLLQNLTREDRLARLPLTRLTASEVGEIARALSPSQPGPLAAWLQHNSEGNPYILVELVREAREDGILGADGSLHPERLPGAPLVPQSIYSLIQSRLSRLSERARRLLDVAVAAGREFEFRVLARAATLPEQDALDALDELITAGLIHELGEARFAFDHSLTLEVASREAGEVRRSLLHRQVAEALEAVYEGRTEQFAGLLAWHFAEGDEPERAAPYAYQAGQQAARLAAWSEAIAFYEQALQGSSPAQRLSIWMSLGEAYLNAGQHVKASETYRDALHWARHHAEESRQDEIELALARSLLTQARFAEAIALAQNVLNRGSSQSAMQAELMWGTALSIEGSDLEEAGQHLRAAGALCTLEDDASLEEPPQEKLSHLAQIKFELGSVLAMQGDLQQAVALYREALEAANRAGDENALERRILAYNNLGYHLLLLGDESAREFALAGLKLAEEKGIIGLLPYLLSTCGEIALTGQDLDAAESYFNRGLEIAERLAMPERIAGLRANLGLLALQRGQMPLGIHRLSTALGLANALGTSHLAAQIRLWLAPHLPPAEGRAMLAEVHTLAESSGRKRLLEEAKRLEGTIVSQDERRRTKDDSRS